MDGNYQSPYLERFVRKCRILQLLDATEKAGLNPIKLHHFHAIAYFSNVLSPIWDLRPLDGKILKRLGGPYYPQLQGDLDRLVGQGLVRSSDVRYFRDKEGIARLSATYELNVQMSEGALDVLTKNEEEVQVGLFLRELAYAVAELSMDEFDRAINEDVTYKAPSVGVGFVVDFAEWRQDNPSERLARRFDEFLPLVRKGASPGEKLNLYIHYLDRVAHG